MVKLTLLERSRHDIVAAAVARAMLDALSESFLVFRPLLNVFYYEVLFILVEGALSSACCRHWRIWEHLLDMRLGTASGRGL